MTIELSSPRPRLRPRRHHPVEIGFIEAIFLRPAQRLRIPFDRVLSRRRSIREFGGPLSVARLGPLLWLAVKTRAMGQRPGPPDWQSRPYPSAGGCHEIELLVMNVSGHTDAAFIYDPRHHALGALPKIKRKHVRQFLTELDPILPARRATVFWFLADISKLAAKYISPRESALEGCRCAAGHAWADGYRAPLRVLSGRPPCSRCVETYVARLSVAHRRRRLPSGITTRR